MKGVVTRYVWVCLINVLLPLNSKFEVLEMQIIFDYTIRQELAGDGL